MTPEGRRRANQDPRQALAASVLVQFGLLRVRQWRDWIPTYPERRFVDKVIDKLFCRLEHDSHRYDLADFPLLRI